MLPKHLQNSMIRFRLSNHKLPIEKLRHVGVNRSDRICDKCHSSRIDDEYHYLFECEKLRQERELYLGRNINRCSAEKTVFELFNSRDAKKMYNLSKFI